jgi:hypothetical protein
MADKDRKQALDLVTAERMLRKAVEIVLSAEMVHARAFAKLALFIDEVIGTYVMDVMPLMPCALMRLEALMS